MPTMVASKDITYGGKTVKAGEQFDVDAQYVATLVSLNRATVVPEDGGKADTKAGVTGRASTTAETKPAAEPKPAAKPAAEAKTEAAAKAEAPAKPAEPPVTPPAPDLSQPIHPAPMPGVSTPTETPSLTPTTPAKESVFKSRRKPEGSE